MVVGTGASPITGVAVSATGSGYQIGDVVGIVTADMSGSGSGCRLGIASLGGLDTLFLTNIQAEEFTVGNSITYNHSAGTVVDSGLDVITYDATGSKFTGEYARVGCFNHGMYSSDNKVIISGATPDTLPTVTSTIVNSTTSAIAIATTTNCPADSNRFHPFGGRTSSEKFRQSSELSCPTRSDKIIRLCLVTQWPH